MTTIALPIRNSGAYGLLDTDRGVSDDASRLRDRWSDLVSDLTHGTVSLGETVRKAQSRLEEVAVEAGVDNWDGYGASALDPLSMALAIRFLRELPPHVPVPEVAIDPDGDVLLEWRPAARRRFNVSLQADGDVTYAGIAGTARFFGTERFDDAIPLEVLHKLGRVLGGRTAGRRS